MEDKNKQSERPDSESISIAPLLIVGVILGLAIYGLHKLVSDGPNSNSAPQAFDFMDEMRKEGLI